MKIAKQLTQKKLLWGVIVIVVTQVLGMLPSLDFLTPEQLKLISFTIGVFLTVARGVELFYDKSAQMESEDDDEPTETKP